MTAKPVLRIDWATHEAAKYAVENWHYSKSLPVPPLVKIGAWEDGKFIGTVIFSRGASPALLAPYGLKQTEGCELTRVAFRGHVAPISRILALAIKWLKKNSPKLRLIVSFADPMQNHHGGIYQANGWLYSGQSAPSVEWKDKAGNKWHGRQVSKTGVTRQFGNLRASPKISDCEKINCPGKHRYLLALDHEMKQKIEPMRKQYPKRAGSKVAVAPAFHAGEGGAEPTSALQKKEPVNG